jgi:hypothetical protein
MDVLYKPEVSILARPEGRARLANRDLTILTIAKIAPRLQPLMHCVGKYPSPQWRGQKPARFVGGLDTLTSAAGEHWSGLHHRGRQSLHYMTLTSYVLYAIVWP